MDFLINSAGLNLPNRRWRDITNETWNTIIDVDLNGAFNVSHAALKVMREQRDGLIVNVSSMASQRVGGVSGIAYTSAKTALNAMSESINHENCHLGIRACALCPGEVATEILDLRPAPPSAQEVPVQSAFALPGCRAGWRRLCHAIWLVLCAAACTYRPGQCTAQ